MTITKDNGKSYNISFKTEQEKQDYIQSLRDNFVVISEEKNGFYCKDLINFTVEF